MGRQIPGLGDVALFQKEPTTHCENYHRCEANVLAKLPWFQHDCLRQESWTSSMRYTCSLQPWYRSHDVETFDINGWCQLWAGIFGTTLNACEEPGSECWVDYSDSHFNHHDLLRSPHSSIRTPLNMIILSHSLKSVGRASKLRDATVGYWMHWRTGSRILWSCTRSWVMHAVKPLLTGAVKGFVRRAD